MDSISRSSSNTVSVPLYQDMSKDLNYSEEILDASYAANSAALAFGSIIFVPFAMVFGRRVVYIVTSLIIFGCNVWSARTQGPAEIIAYNILLGLAGGSNESLWQMTVRGSSPCTGRHVLTSYRSPICSLSTNEARSTPYTL